MYPVPPPELKRRFEPADLLPNHLAVAVFGPGEGESILVRLPDGRLGVVDGCVEPRKHGRADPVSELLTALAGSSKKVDLEFVCLTHVHDDHYAGLGRLLSEHAGRVKHVWFGRALHRRAIQEQVELAERAELKRRKRTIPDRDFKGVKRVLSELHKAFREGRAAIREPRAGLQLLRTPSIHGADLEVWAWGPTDIDVANADQPALAALGRGGLPRQTDPNTTSSALLLSWGSSSILLGGDLLANSDPRAGWGWARDQAPRPVQVVKVAHHGSQGAHDGGLWDQMKPQLAIVTPFRRALNQNPPRPEQIAALCANAKIVITSPPDWHRTRTASGPARVHRSKFGGDDTANAVAVSMDAAGRIVRLVLAGNADTYE